MSNYSKDSVTVSAVELIVLYWQVFSQIDTYGLDITLQKQL